MKNQSETITKSAIEDK